MSWNVNDEEFRTVVALPAPERYAYFIKRAAGHGELWSLTDTDGWVIAVDDENTGHIPVWPHPRFASACAEGPWQDAKPTPIEIDEWVVAWLPKVREDGLRVAVFQTPEDKGVGVSADRLKSDLEDELAAFELG